jgi:hypothetical protein
MKVRRSCESEAYEVEECSNWVDDEKGRECVTRAGGQIKGLVIGARCEEAI